MNKKQSLKAWKFVDNLCISWEILTFLERSGWSGNDKQRNFICGLDYISRVWFSGSQVSLSNVGKGEPKCFNADSSSLSFRWHALSDLFFDCLFGNWHFHKASTSAAEENQSHKQILSSHLTCTFAIYNLGCIDFWRKNQLYPHNCQGK